jgi:hypothetical protein
MRNKLLAAALCLLALASLAFVQSRPVSWEYKQTHDFREANKLGADGWEMVAVEGGSAVSTFYFKRAK